MKSKTLILVLVVGALVCADRAQAQPPATPPAARSSGPARFRGLRDRPGRRALHPCHGCPGIRPDHPREQLRPHSRAVCGDRLRRGDDGARSRTRDCREDPGSRAGQRTHRARAGGPASGAAGAHRRRGDDAGTIRDRGRDVPARSDHKGRWPHGGSRHDRHPLPARRRTAGREPRGSWRTRHRPTPQRLSLRRRRPARHR